MPTLTTNLFWGQGEGDHRLDVIEGHWPHDMAGAVFVVGPDKQRPGGHWFDQQGLLCKIHLIADRDGRVVVQHRRLRTRIDRLRRRLPRLFRTLSFMELSPFGLSNLANTNVATIGDRLFIGYDAGRPLEVDPETMEVITPIGANHEWLQATPGLIEPGVSVAAHPAPDHDAGRLWFVNYSPLPVDREVYVAAWDLDGPVRRWRIEGMGEFDSIHDIKATRRHLVFCDLPFNVEPSSFAGAPPSRPNKDTTTLWIVAKADLEATPVGGTVRCREIVLPLPTGHLSVDEDDSDGLVRVYLEHIPIQDLMVIARRDSTGHFTGERLDPNLEGMVTLAVQPGAVGRYVIDTTDGRLVDHDVAWDERFWGAVLATRDESTPAARARQGQLWYSGLGFDPELIPEDWWRLYADADLHRLVDPADLPRQPVPAGLARFDRHEMKVAEVFHFPAGTFAHPPTFVPRRGAEDPDDGYVVTVVHRDGSKQVWVFDALHLERGPLAVAGAGDFNPPLLLHSCWMPPRPGPRPSDYRVRTGRDVRGALAAIPRHVRSLARAGRQMRAEAG